MSARGPDAVVGVRLVRMRHLMSKWKPSVMIAPAEAAEILIDQRQSKQLVDLALFASIVNLAIFCEERVQVGTS